MAKNLANPSLDFLDRSISLQQRHFGVSVVTVLFGARFFGHDFDVTDVTVGLPPGNR
jgi:hypothetical protein